QRWLALLYYLYYLRLRRLACFWSELTITFRQPEKQKRRLFRRLFIQSKSNFCFHPLYHAC
ncbi:MAG: hypothetical protein J6W29_02840, partial [Neisseriaceae bacterium]|nr:hypothetical protein [Neisseriaceae bacterium]